MFSLQIKKLFLIRIYYKVYYIDIYYEDIESKNTYVSIAIFGIIIRIFTTNKKDIK